MAKVSCILRHQGMQLILAYSWARPAILVAGKDIGGICFFIFIPVPLSSLFFSFISSTISSISFLPLSVRWHKMTHKGWRVIKLQHNQIHVNCLPSKQFTCNVKSLLWKIQKKKILECCLLQFCLALLQRLRVVIVFMSPRQPKHNSKCYRPQPGSSSEHPQLTFSWKKKTKKNNNKKKNEQYFCSENGLI